MRSNGKSSIHWICRKIENEGKGETPSQRKEKPMTQEYFINNETKANEILNMASLNGAKCYKKMFNDKGQGIIKVEANDYDIFRSIERMLRA